MLLREKRTLCPSLEELKPVRSFSTSEAEPLLNCAKANDRQRETAWASTKELSYGKTQLLLLG